MLCLPVSLHNAARAANDYPDHLKGQSYSVPHAATHASYDVRQNRAADPDVLSMYTGMAFPADVVTKLTGILELLGGMGMLVGLKVSIILIISSAGLALLMIFGFRTRLKMKDGFWLSFPSFFFMLLNLYVFLSVI